MRINICVKGTGVLKTEETRAFVPPAPLEVFFSPVEVRKELIRIGITATATAAILTPFLSTPQAVFAFAGETGVSAFDNIRKSVMVGFDSGVVLVIIFSGACWALGHRGKALEILIGVCCGYLLARHAVDIRDFLKGI